MTFLFDIRHLAAGVTMLSVTLALLVMQSHSEAASSLSAEHIAAINRPRRVVVNFDVIHGDPSFTRDIQDLLSHRFTFTDKEGVQIDSIWWNWGEGHQAPHPSEIMPLYDHPGYRKWVEEGIDIAQVFLEATHQRGLECFYSYRINGSDNDLGPFDYIPMKLEHPDWLIGTPWQEKAKGYFDFSVPGARAYKLSILREVARNYDFDGIELDFARLPVTLPPGHQWEKRKSLTEFMRSVRAMTLEVGRERGRPLLLAARIPENILGCHLDGIDIETWAREQLLDLLALGVRSLDVDIEDFRRITTGTNIKLYPCLDDHHSSDGYRRPPVEVLRGVYANWWSQGCDGVYTFNWAYVGGGEHLQAYQQIGSPQTLAGKNKTFVVQRRGGGHGASVIPNPEDWYTPRWMYFNTNMFAPLPAALDNHGKVDTLLTVRVGDDVAAEAPHIEDLTLRVLLSDPAAEGLPDEQTTARILISVKGRVTALHNSPPSRDIVERIEVRLNGVLLGTPTVADGWLMFRPDPKLFGVGENLVGILVTGRDPQGPQMTVEKLEVHVKYRQP